MKIRILLALALGLALALAPAAQATTATVWDGVGKTITLTNDADAESFTVTLDYTTGYEYKVTATNAALALNGAPCASQDGGKTIYCDAADGVKGLYIKGGEGGDSFTVNGATYYDGSPLLDLRGGEGNDTFTAGPDAALRGGQISGENGDDTFNGSATGSDYFRAEPGNDTYKGGTAPVPAGADPDSYQRAGAADGWEPVGDTPVSISLDGQANDVDGQGGTDNLVDIESVVGTKGNDTLTAGGGAVTFDGRDGDDVITGSPLSDQLGGSEGNDVVRGGGGDDYLYDGDRDESWRLASDPAPVVGNDTLDGGDGNDFLYWGAGKDDIIGGAGVDDAQTSRLKTQVFETEKPADFVAQSAGLTISLNDQADDGPTGANEGDNVHADVENLAIDDGLMFVARTTRLIASATAPAADSITGSAAANTISTGGGNDTIDPGAGADTVNAGLGDDTINAVDKATDVVNCGKGTDSVGADLAGTNPGRADVLRDCETVTGTPLGLEGGALPTAPKVTVGGATTYKVKKFLRNYTVTADVTSDQEATVGGELTKTGAKLAKVGALPIGSGKLKAGTGKRTLKVKVAVKYRKALKRKLRTKKQRRKGIKLSLVVTVRNAAGQTTTSTRTIKVKG